MTMRERWQQRWRRFTGHRAGHHALRWAPVVGLSVFTFVLFPVTQGVEVATPEMGAVSVEDVVAPFAFDVLKTPEELEADGDDLAARVRPIYEYDASAVDTARAVVSRLIEDLAGLGESDTAVVLPTTGLRLTAEEVAYLRAQNVQAAFGRTARRMVDQYLVEGVAPVGTIENELSAEVVLRRDSAETSMVRDSIWSRARFFQISNSFHPDPNSAVGDQVFVKILNLIFRPTVVPNEAETEARRAAVRASVNPVADHVQENERIINIHEIVTPRAHRRLLALQQELLDRGGLNEGRFRGTVGQILTNGLVIAVFWLLLMLYIPTVYRELRHLLLFSTLFGVVAIAAAVNYEWIHQGAELIPIPFAALVITMLFNGRIAMVAAMVLAVLLGSQVAYGGQDAFYIALLGGVAAALSVRGISRRSEILGSAAVVTAAFAFAALTVGLRVGWTPSEMGMSIVRGMSNAIVSAALAFLALPIFERWTGTTTDMSLLELSDPNRPLLRRLATEVPGTYAHSVAMANLCENACDAIGADGLLARVGCYYHDVGKLVKPLHFVENQGVGGNPHDRLPPDVSAKIIRSHVVEGIRLAEEARLPAAVKNFIPEHHGTAEITYFLDRARKEGLVSDESVAQFSYPGPKPQTAETAVCMLADGVEAALRVLDEPSPKKVRDAIDHVVRQRIDAGQLDDAPLTISQLNMIKDEFVRTLSGMYHNRLDYPEEAGGITANFGATTDA